jgi:hypothetical protein
VIDFAKDGIKGVILDMDGVLRSDSETNCEDPASFKRF